MKNGIIAILGITLTAVPYAAHAKLNVVTTTTDLRSLAAEVGGEHVSIDSIGKGTQDPHYIEAKPSFMVKVSRADLLIAVGLDMEVGWLPSITRGARNPECMPGHKGYLEVGPSIQALEVPSGSVTRAEGDVHPYGNPHFWLDPIRAGQAAAVIADRLAELDPGHASQYKANAKALQNRLHEKTKGWQARIDASGVKRIVTYHKTLTYFFDRFKLANPAILEPKPGIPPTSGHIIEVIELIQREHVPLILVENYFDATVTNKIKQQIPSVRVATVAVAVEGAQGIDSLDALYESLVKAVEGK